MIDYERLAGTLSIVFICWGVVWGLQSISYAVFSRSIYPVSAVILAPVVLAAIFALSAWASLGIHHEGGEEMIEVVDFVPTAKDENTVALSVFLIVLIPSLIGTFRGYRLSLRKRESISQQVRYNGN